MFSDDSDLESASSADSHVKFRLGDGARFKKLATSVKRRACSCSYAGRARDASFLFVRAMLCPFVSISLWGSDAHGGDSGET